MITRRESAEKAACTPPCGQKAPAAAGKGNRQGLYRITLSRDFAALLRAFHARFVAGTAFRVVVDVLFAGSGTRFARFHACTRHLRQQIRVLRGQIHHRSAQCQHLVHVFRALRHALVAGRQQTHAVCQAVFARAHARQGRSVHRSKTCIFSSRAVTRMVVRVVMAAVRMVAVCNGGSGGSGQRSSQSRLDKMTTVHVLLLKNNKISKHAQCMKPKQRAILTLFITNLKLFYPPPFAECRCQTTANLPPNLHFAAVWR